MTVAGSNPEVMMTLPYAKQMKCQNKITAWLDL